MSVQNSSRETNAKTQKCQTTELVRKKSLCNGTPHRSIFCRCWLRFGVHASSRALYQVLVNIQFTTTPTAQHEDWTNLNMVVNDNALGFISNKHWINEKTWLLTPLNMQEKNTGILIQEFADVMWCHFWWSLVATMCQHVENWYAKRAWAGLALDIFH